MPLVRMVDVLPWRSKKVRGSLEQCASDGAGRCLMLCIGANTVQDRLAPASLFRPLDRHLDHRRIARVGQVVVL